MTWLARIFRAIGRKVVCTCTNPDACPAFGKTRRPIRVPADLSDEISPEAMAWINALPSATITVQLRNCPPGEHELIDTTQFGHRHRHYLCRKCGGFTVCLNDTVNADRMTVAIDCQQCITEAEATEP